VRECLMKDQQHCHLLKRNAHLPRIQVIALHATLSWEQLWKKQSFFPYAASPGPHVLFWGGRDLLLCQTGSCWTVSALPYTCMSWCSWHGLPTFPCTKWEYSSGCLRGGSSHAGATLLRPSTFLLLSVPLISCTRLLSITSVEAFLAAW